MLRRKILATFFIVGCTLPGSTAQDCGVAVDCVAVSVKHVLASSGRRIQGAYVSDVQIEDTLATANEILERIGARWRLLLTEILDVPSASSFYDLDDHWALETAAKSDKRRYGWRDEAINIYLVGRIGGGICSFPREHDIIAIDSVEGIPNGAAGWLHEIGHFLSLTHTFECYDEFGCDTSECTGEAAYHGEPRGEVRCADTCPDFDNVMSYYELLPTEARLTPCQLSEMDYELYDPRGSRSGVLIAGPGFFKRGDPNGDNRVNLSDAVLILDVLFAGIPALDCDDVVDTNDDGALDLADSIYLLQYLFEAGPQPPQPWGTCGGDPTGDGLSCDNYGKCE